MLLKTHLVVTLFFGFLFSLVKGVESPFLFILLILVFSSLPDVDSRFSKIGKKKSLRGIQIFFQHRGFLHSFIFVLLVFIILREFSFILSLSFLFGYGGHIFLDCFTRQGVRIFYPFDFKIKGFLKSGGFIESFLFYFFLVFDIFLFVIFLNVFL